MDQGCSLRNTSELVGHHLTQSSHIKLIICVKVWMKTLNDLIHYASHHPQASRSHNLRSHSFSMDTSITICASFQRHARLSVPPLSDMQWVCLQISSLEWNLKRSRCHVFGDPAMDVQTTVVRQARHVYSRRQNLVFHVWSRRSERTLLRFRLYIKCFRAAPTISQCAVMWMVVATLTLSSWKIFGCLAPEVHMFTSLGGSTS